MPEMKGHPLCPLKAYLNMLTCVPTKSDNEPLLMLPVTRQAVDHMLSNKYLKVICQVLQLGRITTHDFRRSGAELSYRAGVNFTQIKTHGTWASDKSLWGYISKQATAMTSEIPYTLKKLLS